MDRQEYEYKCNRIRENYNFIIDSISEAATKSGRSINDITFVAATKTVPAEFINFAISLGLSDIGENRVQELMEKYEDLDLTGKEVTTHFIGHLQKNKVKYIIDKVDLIQSVDSVELLKVISNQAKKINKVQDVLIEINIGREENKSGIYLEEIEQTLYEMSNINNVNVRGFMAIPPKNDHENQYLREFLKLGNLFIDKWNKKMDNINMKYLSVGMSSDFYEAILNGANMVRIGSLLFGERKWSEKQKV